MTVTIRIPIAINGEDLDPIEFDYCTVEGEFKAVIIDGEDVISKPEIFSWVKRLAGGEKKILERLPRAMAEAREEREERRGA